MRGQKDDYRGWARAAGGEGRADGEGEWNWRDMKRLFQKDLSYGFPMTTTTTATTMSGTGEQYLGEETMGVGEAFPGKSSEENIGNGGRWHVAPQRLRWEVLDTFIDAAKERGWTFSPHFNSSDVESVGYFQCNQRNGVRLSAYRAFLKPAIDEGRSTLTLRTNSHLKRILLTSSSSSSSSSSQISNPLEEEEKKFGGNDFGRGGEEEGQINYFHDDRREDPSYGTRKMRARGMEYFSGMTSADSEASDGAVQRAYARREVILCAGKVKDWCWSLALHGTFVHPF